MKRFFFAVFALASISGCSGRDVSSAVPPASRAANVAEISSPRRVLYVSNLGSPSGIGEILVYPTDIHQSNPALLRTIATGAGKPNGLWVDSSGNLYVINSVKDQPNPSLSEFRPGAQRPFRIITAGLSDPATVAVDGLGTVYVNDSVVA